MPGAGGCVDHGIASPALAATARAWQLRADWLRDVAPGWRARLPVFAPSRAVVLRHVAARLLAAPVLAVCQLVFFAHFHAVAAPRDAARTHVAPQRSARLRAVSRQPVCAHSRAAALPQGDGAVARERVDPQIGAAPRHAVVLLPCAHRPHFRAPRRLGAPVARERQGAGVRLPAEASLAELVDWRAAEKVWARPLPPGSRRAAFRALDLEPRLAPPLPLKEEPPVERFSAWGGSADRLIQRNAGLGSPVPLFGGCSK